MTEHDTPAIQSESAEPEHADEAALDTQPTRPRSSRGPWWLLFLLLLMACGGAYYWVDTIHRGIEQARDEQLAGMEQTAQALRDELGATAAELNSSAAASDGIAAQMDDLSGAQTSLAESVKALYAKESQTDLDWVLAEVEYLVFAANQRLALEGDAPTAASALHAADRRLQAAQHPDLLGLRKQLAADIAALEAVKQPDVEGLAIYLANASAGVDDLPTRPIAAMETSFSRATTSVGDGEGITETLRALWTDVKNLVEVKDGKLEDGVLFDPELRYFLQQNLRLELASARLSVLQQDTNNFRAAATLIIDLLESYYDTEAGSVSAIIKRLAEAHGIELSPPVPSITASLDAVRSKRADIRDAAVAGR